MSKTITLRIDDETYGIFKRAAQGNRRTISNFLEFAALSYLTQDTFVADEEMDALLNDKEMMRAFRKARTEIEAGEYEIVS